MKLEVAKSITDKTQQFPVLSCTSCWTWFVETWRLRRNDFLPCPKSAKHQNKPEIGPSCCETSALLILPVKLKRRRRLGEANVTENSRRTPAEGHQPSQRLSDSNTGRQRDVWGGGRQLLGLFLQVCWGPDEVRITKQMGTSQSLNMLSCVHRSSSNFCFQTFVQTCVTCCFTLQKTQEASHSAVCCKTSFSEQKQTKQQMVLIQ